MLERQAGGETSRRWELYRVLAEPLRLRVLALAAEDELAIGELSDLLREPQPNVSRHVQSLKRGGLLAMRKQGTRALVRVEADALRDAVIADAVAAGRRLCAADGSLVRLPEVIALREQEARAFFASNDEVRSPGVDFDTRAHLLALGMLLPRR
ncbi:MAG: winged helix-turn-helix transcriptional regulator, partial [Myxococcales bacterium]|nr:winged helix-turn-helix transcriptional regulator [Myxococcales bacterium]